MFSNDQLSKVKMIQEGAGEVNNTDQLTEGI